MVKRARRLNLRERKASEFFEEVREHLITRKGLFEADNVLNHEIENSQRALAAKEAELTRVSRRCRETEYSLMRARHDLDEAIAAIAWQAIQISKLSARRREDRRPGASALATGPMSRRRSLSLSQIRLRATRVDQQR